MLKKFNVNESILALFYNSIICSVWQYNLVSWGGNIKDCDKNSIEKLIRRAGRLANVDFLNYESCFLHKVKSKFDKIMIDHSHPLHDIFEKAIIPRSGRMRMPIINTNRYRFSFTPQCIKLYNFNFNR